jgi:hypothetical protein
LQGVGEVSVNGLNIIASDLRPSFHEELQHLSTDKRVCMETQKIDDLATALDQWIDPELRLLLEQQYWTDVEFRTSLDELAKDANFRTNPSGHIGLFSDHGVRHARDVALRTLELITLLHGTTIAARTAERLEFIQGCAVVLAYLHDVGMSAPIPRKFHAQYASQLVFQAEFATVLSQLLDTDAGLLSSTIDKVNAKAPFGTSTRQVAQEVLATAVCHSKSSVPAAVMHDRTLLRQALLKSATQPVSEDPLESLDATGRTQAPPTTGTNTEEQHRFGWVVANHPDIEAFADDVLDAARIVRMADAMRQRGATLRTSQATNCWSMVEPVQPPQSCVRTIEPQPF